MVILLLNVQLKNGLYWKLSDKVWIWLDEHLRRSWYFFGQNGAIFINFQIEEDKCIFILKYGDFIA